MFASTYTTDHICRRSNFPPVPWDVCGMCRQSAPLIVSNSKENYIKYSPSQQPQQKSFDDDEEEYHHHSVK